MFCLFSYCLYNPAEEKEDVDHIWSCAADQRSATQYSLSVQVNVFQLACETRADQLENKDSGICSCRLSATLINNDGTSVLSGFDHLDAFVCYLHDIYYTNNDPIVSFAIRGVNVTGSPTGKKVMQTQGDMVINDNGLLALSDQSITQMQIHIGINTCFSQSLAKI